MYSYKNILSGFDYIYKCCFAFRDTRIIFEHSPLCFRCTCTGLCFPKPSRRASSVSDFDTTHNGLGPITTVEPTVHRRSTLERFFACSIFLETGWEDSSWNGNNRFLLLFFLFPSSSSVLAFSLVLAAGPGVDASRKKVSTKRLSAPIVPDSRDWFNYGGSPIPPIARESCVHFFRISSRCWLHKNFISRAGKLGAWKARHASCFIVLGQVPNAS